MSKEAVVERLIRRILAQPHSCIDCLDGTDRLSSMCIMKWQSQLMYLFRNADNEYMLQQLSINDKYPREEE